MHAEVCKYIWVKQSGKGNEMGGAIFFHMTYKYIYSVWIKHLKYSLV